MIRILAHVLLFAVSLQAPISAAEPDAPKELAVPVGHTLVATVKAKGVQVYKAVEGKTGKWEWILDGPLADLSDEQGKRVGRHYDGPAWEAADGSKVVRDTAEAVKQSPAPDPKADIPWLLVRVKAADDTPGAFAGVVYIQRLNTAGGKAPADAPKRAGTKIGVPYTAVYQLWAKAG
ncbi:DUF3455 domain-containing protein [Fimbriiglobus ruber]|uniref:DUF3455 domain-containing protein n=1 Tax=Fimbriiglobus ruber TaxID=1908690 RepID=A0A225D9A5_9BACT|nr:DUF3455 domain-containing protein [Fimbriiglobus ruber]OWK35128.1 hypothetical protein FRUB_09970 [Fimbriiglobus ruber]